MLNTDSAGPVDLGSYAMRVALAAGILALTACTTTMDRDAPRGVVADGAQFEIVSTVGKVFGEGVVAARNGQVYVLDVTWGMNPDPGGSIYRHDPSTGATTKFLEPSGSALGLHIDRNNDLIIAEGARGGGRQICRLGHRQLADRQR